MSKFDESKVISEAKMGNQLAYTELLNYFGEIFIDIWLLNEKRLRSGRFDYQDFF